MSLISLLFRIVIVLLITASIQSCKNGAVWQIHETSPVDFAGKKAGHYFLSVAVSWSDGTFDSLNTKKITLYMADDRLDSRGLRVGELLKKAWEVEGGSVSTKFVWDDDVVSVHIIDDSEGRVLLRRRIKVESKTATLVE